MTRIPGTLHEFLFMFMTVSRRIRNAIGFKQHVVTYFFFVGQQHFLLWCRLVKSMEKSPFWEANMYKLITKFFTFNDNQSFMTMFTTACHWSVSFVPDQSNSRPHIPFKIRFIITLSSKPDSCKTFLSFRFFHQNFINFSFLPCFLHAPTQISLLDFINKIYFLKCTNNAIASNHFSSFPSAPSSPSTSPIFFPQLKALRVTPTWNMSGYFYTILLIYWTLYGNPMYSYEHSLTNLTPKRQ